MAELTGDGNNKTFSSYYSSGPVTALAAVSFRKVIAGCGNELLIYNLENVQLEARKKVLEVASVHGICKGPTRKTDQQLLCVYGAKEVRIVALKKLGNVGCELDTWTPVFKVYDWIWTARWLKGEDKREPIALALAHNSVALWYWKSGRIATVQHCVENCILYSAHLIGETWDSLVLAAGTVFNQVVIWSVCDVGHDSEQAVDKEAEPVIHSLAGHKGVIFSIKYHTEYQRLCSVSDDRSIQMWQLTFPGSPEGPPTVEDWKSMKSVLLLTLYGHTARVWDAVLLKECFASIGEDATCYVWDYDGKIVSKFKGHKGRSIWSLAVTEDENTLITGGGDSSIRMWEIQSESSWSSAQRVIDIPQDLTLVEGDFPRTICLLSFNIVLVMLNSGCFSSYSLSDHSWTCLFKDERFVSYSVMSHCPDKRKVAVGSITGAIKVLSITDDSPVEQVEQILFDGKVMGITWMTEEMLLVSGPEGQCQILTVTRDQDHSKNSLVIAINMDLFLPPSKHRWITAACFIDAPLKQMLVCGDKDGFLFCYLCSSLDFTPASDQGSPIAHLSQTLQRVHGKTGVTSVHFKDGVVYSTGRDGCYKQWEVKDGKLTLSHSVKVTKGFEWIDKLEWHDGDMLVYGFLSSYFVIWSVSGNQQLVSIPCGGGHRSWGCCYEESALRFAFLKSGQIYVVDSKQQNKQSIIKYPLHGRELYDVKFMRLIERRNEKPAFLICTTSEDTTINVGSLSGKKDLTSWKPLLSLKGHLSSVRCVAISSPAQEDSSCQDTNSGLQLTAAMSSDSIISSYIIFTGGGRAEIRAWKVCVSDKESMTNQGETPDKASCTPAEFSPHGFCSKAHCVEVEYVMSGTSTHTEKSMGKGDSLISCTYKELSTHFLGESRHKSRFSNWKARKLRLDPETRVMSLAATPLSALRSYLTCRGGLGDEEIQGRLKDLHIISAAGSDGVLRVFSYDTFSRQLLARTQSSLHKGCVLKVMHFLVKTDDEAHPVFCLLSTATNGCILIWSLRDVAQNIVKTLQVKKRHKGGQRQERETANGHSASNDNASRPAADSADLSDTDEEYTDLDASRENPEGATEAWQPICQLKSHQSGVNSISAYHYKDNLMLIASGGDDNALTVQMVEFTESKVSLLSKVTKADAHAAQITGVWLVSSSIVVSASIDQRICVWTLNTETQDIKLTMLKCKYIHIADASSMDVYLHGDSIYILIGGEGICLYEFK